MSETSRFAGHTLAQPSAGRALESGRGASASQWVSERKASGVSRANLLVDRMASGDPDALAEIYDRYDWLVRGIVQGALPDAEGVDEIVQAVFVQAWREAELYDAQSGAPMAWLSAMARKRALARLKRRWRALGPTMPTAGAPPAEHPPSPRRGVEPQSSRS